MDRLVTQLSRLPSIGKRSAQRLAFHLLKSPAQDAAELAAAITDLKQNARHCSECFNLTESDPCPICADPKRDQATILVVEQPSDIAAFEATGTYRGVYHVLMGRLSPLDGLGPGELTVEPLLRRAKPAAPQADPTTAAASDPGSSAKPTHSSPPVREVILGMGPTLEGDGTALYLAQRLQESGVNVTRLARGLPTGSTLEMVSKAVLSDSIQGRHAMPVD